MDKNCSLFFFFYKIFIVLDPKINVLNNTDCSLHLYLVGYLFYIFTLQNRILIKVSENYIYVISNITFYRIPYKHFVRIMSEINLKNNYYLNVIRYDL